MYSPLRKKLGQMTIMNGLHPGLVEEHDVTDNATEDRYESVMCLNSDFGVDTSQSERNSSQVNDGLIEVNRDRSLQQQQVNMYKHCPYNPKSHSVVVGGGAKKKKTSASKKKPNKGGKKKTQAKKAGKKPTKKPSKAKKPSSKKPKKPKVKKAPAKSKVKKSKTGKTKAKAKRK